MIDQTPPAGNEVEAGGEVDIVLAATPRVEVPSVVDLSVDDAIAELEDANLVVGDQIPRTTRTSPRAR